MLQLSSPVPPKIMAINWSSSVLEKLLCHIEIMLHDTGAGTWLEEDYTEVWFTEHNGPTPHQHCLPLRDEFWVAFELKTVELINIWSYLLLKFIFYFSSARLPIFCHQRLLYDHILPHHHLGWFVIVLPCEVWWQEVTATNPKVFCCFYQFCSHVKFTQLNWGQTLMLQVTFRKTTRRFKYKSDYGDSCSYMRELVYRQNTILNVLCFTSRQV